MNKQITIPRTFRISRRILERLEQEAKRQGLTVNTLVNKILGQYVDSGVYVELYGYIIFSTTTFHKLIQHLSDKSLKAIAREAGAVSLKETAHLMGLPIDADSFCEVLEKIVCNFAKWANYCEYRHGSHTTIVLSHQKGRKWSMFLAEYVSSSLEQFLGKFSREERSSVKIVTTETSVIVSLPTRLFTRRSEDLLRELSSIRI